VVWISPRAFISRDATLLRTQLASGGAIALASGRDINLEATHDSYTESHESTVKKSGFVLNHGLAPMQQGKTTDRDSSTTQTIAHGTTLSGDSVTAAAGRNIVGEGVQIAATNDVLLAAGNDLTLTTAESTYSTGQDKSVTYTGFSRQGLNDHYGKVKDNQGQSDTEITHTGSLVGSTDGQVTLTAGNNLHLTGTDVISNKATTIVGKNVTIDAAVDTSDTTQFQRHNEGGITVGLGGSMVELAMDARNSVKRGSEVDDDRLKALYAAKAYYDGKDILDTYKTQGIGAGKGGAGQEGINVQVGIGGKSASSKTTSHDETAFGSHIRSSGDVTIAATGGDLTIIGSEVTGDNVALAAAHDINLLSQVENHSLKNDSKNGSGGVGVSFGTDGFGIYAEASIGSGKARGNGITHAETTINADSVLTLISGNDTTIQGAQLKGNQVIANIGKNLTIRSEQDTDDFSSKTMQAGAKVMFGLTQSGFVSASGYYSQGKIDSHYQSVSEVSGVKAGDGGFQLDVGGTTHLIGGQIASSADASKNILSTGDLIYEDLHNESKYKASQVTVSGGSTMASNISGAVGAAVGAMTPQHDNVSSDTHSGIAGGTIIVRNDPGKDLSDLDRNPTLENEALKNAFDQEKVAEQQELTSLAGYTGMRGVGDLAQYMQNHSSSDAERAAWGDGGRNKVILHGLVGAVMASLGGGSVIQGAVGGATSEAASKAMQQYLFEQGVDPRSDDWKAFMELGSAAVGGLVGQGTGALAALDGDKYNRQLHPDLVNFITDNVAAKYAQAKGISEEEARGILIRAAMVGNDDFDSRYLGNADSEQTRTDAMLFLYDNTPVGQNGWVYELSSSPEQMSNAGIGAGKLVQDQKAFASVLEAMNPSGSPEVDIALKSYYRDASYPELYRDWVNRDTSNFLNFNAQLAAFGGIAGLSAGVPLLAAANAGRNGQAVSNITGFIMATRAGSAVTSAGINAFAQYRQDGTVRPTNMAVAAVTGYLGPGGGLFWNTAVGAAGGFVQTELNNAIYNEDKSVWINAAVSGVGGGFGYKVGDKSTDWLTAKLPQSLIPVAGGNAVGATSSEGVGALADMIQSQIDQKIDKVKK